MCLGTERKAFHRTTRIGLWLLILGSLSRWFLHPTARFSAGLIDGLVGTLLIGSIVCMLVGIRKNAS